MIDEIHVENLALIRRATLEPSSGLTVLTGETGAGKTALLSACKLLLGERADKSAVRDGEPALTVSGRFFESSPAGLRDEEGLVVVRKVTSDGRSRVTVQGEMASVGELSRLVAPLVDLCGQHEHQQLANAARHRDILDAWAADSVSGALQAYAAAYAEARDASDALSQVLQAGEASSAQLEEARFTLRRIDEIAPREGEYEELAAYLSKAEHAESLAMAANEAYSALAEDAGAIDSVAQAVAALEAAARYDDRLSGYARSLREASYVLEDVARDAQSYRDGIDYDPDSLAHAQERFAAYQGLLRAYGPRTADMLAAREAAAELVSLADDSEERERVARDRLAHAEEALVSAADALDAARAAAAPHFADAVSSHMARLEMGGARLVCEVTRLPRTAWTAAGPSAVEFMFRPGAAMQARPLAKIASGGEMSRVMLAIKVVLGETDSVDTLVFDEVDAGVGGSVAVALAGVLADLAQTHQVIVVTHLAQVAVRADRHYVVSKCDGDIPETVLTCAEGEDRIREIARMLSGDTTEASVAHAREMLAAAGF